MKVQITVKTNSQREEIKQLPDGSYQVRVNAAPIEGRANKAVIRVLAAYFSVPQSAVTISRGLSGRKKWVDIEM